MSLCLLAGCSGGSGPAAPGSTGGAGATGGPRTASSSPSASPSLVPDDGFLRDSALPPPLGSTTLQLDTGRDVRVDVVSAARQGDTVRVVLAVLPTVEDASVLLGHALTEPRSTGIRRAFDVSGLTLLDTAGRTAYGVERDASGGCLCSQETGAALGPGKTLLVWADLTAPPAGVRTVDVALPTAPPVEQVPLSSTPFPSPAGPVRWTPSGPPPEQPGAGASRRPVLPLSTRTVDLLGVTRQQSQAGEEISLPADVLFAKDSAVLSPRARETIAGIAAQLRTRAAGQQVKVVGHTDDLGSAQHGLVLSRQRAAAVVGALTPQLAGTGITLVPSGVGEADPLVPNRDAHGNAIPANQARNRRVAVVFTPKAPPSPTPAAGSATAAPPLKDLHRATPAPATGGAPGAIASAVTTVDGDVLRADVVRAERVDDYVRLDVVASLVSAADGGDVSRRWGVDTKVFGANDNPGGVNESLTGAQLVDPGGIAYEVVQEPGSVCVCSTSLGAGQLRRDQPLHLYGYFAAPPASVGAVTLRLGRFGDLVGVPLSG